MEETKVDRTTGDYLNRVLNELQDGLGNGVQVKISELEFITANDDKAYVIRIKLKFSSDSWCGSSVQYHKLNNAKKDGCLTRCSLKYTIHTSQVKCSRCGIVK